MARMTGDARTIYDGHILKLELLDDKWEVIRHADAVAVLALNDAGEMLLVRQFRRAVDAHTLEAPAGLIDGEESPRRRPAANCRRRPGWTARCAC